MLIRISVVVNFGSTLSLTFLIKLKLKCSGHQVGLMSYVIRDTKTFTYA